MKTTLAALAVAAAVAGAQVSREEREGERRKRAASLRGRRPPTCSKGRAAPARAGACQRASAARSSDLRMTLNYRAGAGRRGAGRRHWVGREREKAGAQGSRETFRSLQGATFLTGRALFTPYCTQAGITITKVRH